MPTTSDQQINPYSTDSINVTTRLIGTDMIKKPEMGSPVKYLNVSVNELFQLLKENDLSSLPLEKTKLSFVENNTPQYAMYPKLSFQDISSFDNQIPKLMTTSTNTNDLPNEENTIRANLVEAKSSLVQFESQDMTDNPLFLEITILFKQNIASSFQYLQTYILSLKVSVQFGLKQKIYTVKESSDIVTLFEESELTESIEISLKDLFDNLSNSDRNCYITTSSLGNNFP